MGWGARISLPFFLSHLSLQANRGAGAGAEPREGEHERGSYRLRVIKALVQRYIETARREFEESRRKGQWLAPKSFSSSWFAQLESLHFSTSPRCAPHLENFRCLHLFLGM